MQAQVRFLARPAFSLLRPRSSNSLEAEAEEAEDNDKVLSLMLERRALALSLIVKFPLGFIRVPKC